MAILAPAGGFNMEVSLKALPVLGGAENWAVAGRQAAASRVAARTVRFILIGRIAMSFVF
jgi:hypothetical protein